MTIAGKGNRVALLHRTHSFSVVNAVTPYRYHGVVCHNESKSGYGQDIGTKAEALKTLRVPTEIIDLGLHL